MVTFFSVKAQVGFQAKLETPPSFVSPYFEKAHNFSVAIYPQTYPYISYRLKHAPKVIASNFKEKSIRFNTEYYRLGGIKKSLIPVSVDALKYDQFNRNRYIYDKFQDYYRSSIVNINKKKGRGGLGVTIALPTRLNKIFGEGGAGLKVSGFRRVSFAGRSQWTDAAESETYRQSKFPSLRMEQVSRFDITGTIGSKITVKVSQDNQTDIPLANRIQIRYKGDDDDILKSIEAGNTTLSLPNTKFVGYSSRIRGLFGLKAQAQVGHLTLTAIASQEKGSSESASYSPTGEENAQTIRDYEYIERRIFDLGRPGELARHDSVKTLFVYESTDKLDDLDALDANLYVNPNFPDSFTAENILVVKMKRLDDNSYSFYNDPDRNLHYVVFNSTRSKFNNLGYWMVVKRSNGVIDTIGNIKSDTLTLKLLAPVYSIASPNQQTWGLMWRNCYEIPRGITIDDIDIKIFKGLDGTEGSSVNYDYQDENGKTVRYLEILGLDQYNAVDKKVPDNLLDDRIDIFRPDWGLLIFPSRTPFATDTTFVDMNNNSTPVLKDQIPILYKYNSVTERNKASKYYLQLSTKTRSSIIDLHRANIIEGSERVTVNGRLLSRGTDYNIQYDFGRITLLSPDATDPNANLSIDYEYAPFFAVQKKSLLGFRAEYKWSKDLKFGSTFLYKSDKAQERKPKVGEETAKMFVFDTDFNLKLHPNFLTKMADALPLVETQSPSNLTISAEFAQSHPNPNVNGVAYIDDFESALDQLSLGTSRVTWKRASKPYQLGDNYVRGKILWHTPRELVRVEDVYDIQAKQGEGNINTLRLIYRPKDIRIDTVMTDSNIVSIDTVAANSWGGIMRYFNSRVDAQRVQLFEVRARGSHGKLHFDFGRINEDLNGNGISDTEDKNSNGAVDETEDVGLDGLPDSLEPGYNAETNPDPDGDDWYFKGQGKCPVPGGCGNINWNDDKDSLYYEYLNGTEGNMHDNGALGLPDKEALSTTNGLNTNDAYFSYVIDFASDSFRVDNSGKNGWWTYRIPIRDSAAVDKFVVSNNTLTPNWNQITHVRVWFEADSTQTEPDTIE
ncbi:MAG: cell surface protein SprA, partial [FCB group bacterium]|nr:cell surface protein SprA [FCB group bacterium]